MKCMYIKKIFWTSLVLVVVDNYCSTTGQKERLNVELVKMCCLCLFLAGLGGLLQCHLVSPSLFMTKYVNTSCDETLVDGWRWKRIISLGYSVQSSSDAWFREISVQHSLCYIHYFPAIIWADCHFFHKRMVLDLCFISQSPQYHLLCHNVWQICRICCIYLEIKDLCSFLACSRVLLSLNW